MDNKTICACASSYKLPRMHKDEQGKRICDKCYLPRQRKQRQSMTLGESEHRYSNEYCDEYPESRDSSE